MSDRQKILIAVVLSALLHLLLLGCFAVFLWTRPPVKPPLSLTAKPKPLEITVAPFATPTPKQTAKVTPTPIPKAPVEREVIESRGLQTTAKPDEKSLFEADVNLQAGSLLPAMGNVPLPSQKGKERDFTQFANQRYALGEKPGARAAAPPSQPAPARPETTAPPEPRPTQTPSTPPPTASPTSAPSASPMPSVDDKLFALGRPTPVPSRVPKTLEQLRRELAMLPNAPARPPQPSTSRSGFQPNSEQTAVNGGISTNGPAGVNAIATVKGRFEKAIGDAIESRWNYYVYLRSDVITLGTAKVRFLINRQGRLISAHVVSNTSNESFASICIQTISEANFPPLPDELVPMMQDGGFEINYTFTIYQP